MITLMPKPTFKSKKNTYDWAQLIVVGIVIAGMGLLAVAATQPRLIRPRQQTQTEPIAQPQPSEAPLFEQIKAAKIRSLIIDETPVVVEADIPPKLWQKIYEPELGFSLKAPATWKYHGEGRFCENPQPGGGCQDYHPVILKVGNGDVISLRSELERQLAFEDDRFRSKKIRYIISIAPLVYTSANGTSFDGIVQYRQLTGDPDVIKELETSYAPSFNPIVEINGTLYNFLLDLNKPEHRQVFGTLEVTE